MVEARLTQIRVELERATQDTDIEVLQERLAKLSSRLAVIHVGAATGPELKEKLRRTEGALAATRAAMSRGDRRRRRDRAAARRARRSRRRARGRLRGAASTSCAACWPIRCSGSRPTPATTGRRSIDQVRAMPDGHGLNALTGEFGDLFEAGVVDPVRVTRLTLSTRRRSRR